MITTRPVQYRRMTSDEVLAELRLFYRDWGLTDADIRKHVRPEASLLTLARCDDDIDLADLISGHGLLLPDDGWFANLPPERTVGDFCQAVASLTEVPVIEPVTILGTPCETAGAFLTLRQMLADDGADVSDIGPSSDLKAAVVEHPDVFRRFRLATDGRLPLLSVWNPLAALGCAFLLGGAALLIGALWRSGVVWNNPLSVFGLTVLASGTWCYDQTFRRPIDTTRIAFGDRSMTTFRDLIHAALGRPARAA